MPGQDQDQHHGPRWWIYFCRCGDLSRAAPVDQPFQPSGKPSPAVLAFHNPASDLQSEAGFADATGSGQRHDTIGGMEVSATSWKAACRALPFGADEACHGSGEQSPQSCRRPHPRCRPTGGFAAVTACVDRYIHRAGDNRGPIRSSGDSGKDRVPCGLRRHERGGIFADDRLLRIDAIQIRNLQR